MTTEPYSARSLIAGLIGGMNPIQSPAEYGSVPHHRMVFSTPLNLIQRTTEWSSAEWGVTGTEG